MYDKFMCYCDGNTGEMAKSVEEAAQRITELKAKLESSIAEKSQLDQDLIGHKQDLLDGPAAQDPELGAKPGRLPAEHRDGVPLRQPEPLRRLPRPVRRDRGYPEDDEGREGRGPQRRRRRRGEGRGGLRGARGREEGGDQCGGLCDRVEDPAVGHPRGHYHHHEG